MAWKICIFAGIFATLPGCPDSWENMAKLNIADDEDVLYTKYNSNENASPEVNLTNVKEQALRQRSMLH